MPDRGVVVAPLESVRGVVEILAGVGQQCEQAAAGAGHPRTSVETTPGRIAEHR